jgi:putative transcriptional regulator
MTTKPTKTPRNYRNDAMEALHEAATDLHEAGGMDKLTMRRFDLLCLTNVEEVTASEIQALRKRAGVSQSVFARVLNVKPGLISQWERGERRPSGPSLKLLSLIKAKGFEAVV